MQLTPQAQAVMLLAVSFGKGDSAKAKPLSISEWARFASWLKAHDLEPASLLNGDIHSLLRGWADRYISVERISALLGRGAALGLALEKWHRSGLWVLTRSHPDYPERLKRRLRSESPAVLFGCGDQSLLNRGGIAVVGSRDASDEDIAFTETLGKKIAREGHTVVSGGARGIDQSAMLSSADNGGTVIGVLADSLLKTATAAKYRKYIMSGKLVLVTPFNPEAGFNVGNAMSRNRYIYCLADAAAVICSTPNKGGTWAGATEALKADWVPLWVKHNEGPKSGNSELVQRGAHWLPNRPISISSLFEDARPVADKSVLVAEAASSFSRDDSPAIPEATPSATEIRKDLPEQSDGTHLPEREDVAPPAHAEVSFYFLFLTQMLEITVRSALTPEEIATRLELEKPQILAWLKRGVSEHRLKKVTNQKPIKYQAIAAQNPQTSLF